LRLELLLRLLLCLLFGLLHAFALLRLPFRLMIRYQCVRPLALPVP
jgi:hypothetical protein